MRSSFLAHARHKNQPKHAFQYSFSCFEVLVLRKQSRRARFLPKCSWNISMGLGNFPGRKWPRPTFFYSNSSKYKKYPSIDINAPQALFVPGRPNTRLCSTLCSILRIVFFFKQINRQVQEVWGYTCFFAQTENIILYEIQYVRINGIAVCTLLSILNTIGLSLFCMSRLLSLLFFVSRAVSDVSLIFRCTALNWTHVSRRVWSPLHITERKTNWPTTRPCTWSTDWALYARPSLLFKLMVLSLLLFDIADTLLIFEWCYSPR